MPGKVRGPRTRPKKQVRASQKGGTPVGDGPWGTSGIDSRSVHHALVEQRERVRLLSRARRSAGVPLNALFGGLARRRGRGRRLNSRSIRCLLLLSEIRHDGPQGRRDQYGAADSGQPQCSDCQVDRRRRPIGEHMPDIRRLGSVLVARDSPRSAWSGLASAFLAVGLGRNHGVGNRHVLFHESFRWRTRRRGPGKQAFIARLSSCR